MNFITSSNDSIVCGFIESSGSVLITSWLRGSLNAKIVPETPRTRCIIYSQITPSRSGATQNVIKVPQKSSISDQLTQSSKKINVDKAFSTLYAN